MQHVGVRNQPSIINLIVIVVVAMALVIYAIISFATGDFLWFSNSFRETPNAIVLHCYGESIDIDPGSFHFSKLKQIMNESMTGRKRWDSLTMSEGTYQEYQTNPQMIVLEFFYPEPVRVHSTYKFYSYVDNLEAENERLVKIRVHSTYKFYSYVDNFVIPIEGRHSQTNAVFGQANGIPTGGSLHIDSTEQFKAYMTNTELCPVKVVNSN